MLSPALRTLRASQDRVLEREGIPMVLALVNEGGPMPAVGSEAVRAEGERLAAAMDRFREELVPSMREEDNGCLISVLVATSYEDFEALDDAPVQLPEAAAVQPRKEIDA
jgi:hypothetical protein